MDFNLTHTFYGRSNLHPMTQLTYTRRSDGTPEPDGDSKTVVRAKVIHYCQVLGYDEDFYTSRFVLSVFYTITVFIPSRSPTPLLAPSLVFSPPFFVYTTHAGCLFQSFIGFLLIIASE